MILITGRSAVNHAQMFGLSMETPPEPAGYLTDGQKISFGQTELSVIHVPGHAPGSLAFYSAKKIRLFSQVMLFLQEVSEELIFREEIMRHL